MQQSHLTQPSGNGHATLSEVYFPGHDDVRIVIHNSFNDLTVSDWTCCIRDHQLFLSPSYLIAAESSALPGMEFRYAIVYRQNKPVAVVYFQLVNLSDSGLGGILDLDEYGGLASTLSTRINDLLFSPGDGHRSYLLCCGNLLVSGDHAIGAINEESYIIAIESIGLVKKQISSGLGKNSRIVALMVKDFYPETDKLVQPVLKKDYFQLNTDPEMIFEVDKEWKNFDDYLAALSSKYRVRANSARSKMEGIHTRILSEKEIIQSIDEIFNLNAGVMRKAPVKLARPSAKYFLNLKKAFGDNYNIRAFFDGDKMIAFTSALYNKYHFEAHFIGINYDYNKSHNLYQNILYSYIDDVIAAKSKRLYFGRTALEIKSTTGARPHHLACYFKLANRVLNTLARPLVSSTGPGKWIPRDPFRNE